MKCETCGAEVQVIGSCEGTMYYVPTSTAVIGELITRMSTVEAEVRELRRRVTELEEMLQP